MPQVLDPPEINYLDPRPFLPSGTAGQILELATQAISEGRDVGIREICRQLSLTPGAPYSHFESSAHLESVVAYNGLLSMAREINSRTPEAGDPRDRLIAASRAYRNWALANPAMFGFILPTTGRRDLPPFAEHVLHASRALAVPATRALRDGWDTGQFVQAPSGPEVYPLDLPGVVSLNADETRIANALWVTTHGAVVLELAIGTHDGWKSVDPMFDWLITAQLSAHLDPRDPR